MLCEKKLKQIRIRALLAPPIIFRTIVIALVVCTVWTEGYWICSSASEQQDTMPSKNIEDALKKGAYLVKTLPEVIGVGQGVCEGEPCIKLFLIRKTRDLEEQIPTDIDGFRVVSEVTGRVDARSAIPDNIIRGMGIHQERKNSDE